MKTQLWVYIVVAVLSAGAGVAIAGLPSSTPREATIVPPTTTETTVAPAPDESALFEPVASDAASEADDSSASTENDDSVEEVIEPESTTTALPESTTTALPETTTTTTTVPLAERSVFPVAVANGAGTPGLASNGADQLAELGYTQVRALDGVEIVELTTVYYGPDLEVFARRLAVDLGFPEDRIGEIADAPSVPSLRDEPLLVYLGSDSVES